MDDDTEKDFLICCNYEEFCQGWDSTSGYFLVRAFSFEHAVTKLTRFINTDSNKQNPNNFINCTVE